MIKKKYKRTYPYIFLLIFLTLFKGFFIRDGLFRNIIIVRINYLILTSHRDSSYWSLQNRGAKESINSEAIDSIKLYIRSLSTVNKENLMIQGLVCIVGNYYNLAEKYFDEALAINPNDNMIRYWLAVSQYQQGRIEEAKSNWARVNAGLLLINIGRYLWTINLSQKSFDWYEMGISVASASEQSTISTQALGLAYRDMGEIEREQNHLVEAMTLFEQALIYLPNRTDFRYDLANLYSSQGRFGDAINQIRQNLQIQPNYATWLGAMGEIYLESGDLVLAEQYLKQCLQSGSDRISQDRYWHARAWFTLSIIYNQRQAWDDCVNSSIQAVRTGNVIDPSWKYQFSINFKGALAYNPDRLDWYLSIGKMYEDIGDYTTAYVYYSQGEKRWPENKDIKERIQRMLSSGKVIPVEHP